MGEESAPDPQNVDKDSELIKSAQKEIGTTDVLVCGSCHEVFYFVEEFETHKQPGTCTGKSVLKESPHGDCNKPQVWAFMLWKNANYRNKRDGETSPSSWKIYQEWCKLEADVKDAWILAGKNIQTFAKVSDAKLVEVKMKPQVYGRRSNQKVMVTVPSLSTGGNKENNRDPLAEGEIRLSQLPEAQRKALKAQTEANKVSDDADPLGESADLNGKEDADVRKTNDLIKRGIVKPVQLNSDVTILPSNKKQSAKDASQTSNKSDEFGVDKIVSKRYNPRKKTFEYLVKWENSDKNEYTWEPTANLDSCKELVQEYEANLKKQRMQKAQAAALQKQSERKKQKADSSSSGEIIEGRPQRSSKQKALNQVKAWCGDISDADDETPSAKRKFDDDSDSDSFEKKMRMDDDTESDEDDNELKPSVTVRRVTKTSAVTSPVNGVGKKGPAIGKILIPDSKGIVRINQKQASELSTGVYIMSKTAGIIKLDSSASKFATSGGQAIVKVEPRIGQTQIKVVKKDAGGGSVKLTPTKPKITLKSVSRINKEKSEIKSTPNTTTTVPIATTLEKPDDNEDESDDGLPELEFPTDLPLPQPDSPPGDFVLDPETGKIAGQEYPEEVERPIVVEVAAEEKTKECDDGRVTTVEQEKQSGLENLVKLAAADILDDELAEEEEKPIEKVEKVKITPVKPTNTTSGSILQRKLLSTPKPPPPPPPQTIITPTIRKVTTTVKRNTTTTPVISPVRRTVVAKPKPYVPVNSPPTISKVRQSYTNKNMNVHKRIGQTTIYRTPQKKPTTTTTTVHQIVHPQTLLKQQLQQQQQQQKQKAKEKPIILNREAPQQQKIPPPQQVETRTTTENSAINMPLLTETNETEQTTTNEEETATISVPEGMTDLSSTLAELNDSETPLIITGEDGTIYQVAGQNEQGQTILISQGADGQSQCLVVATESLQLEEDSQQQQQQVVQMEGGDGVVGMVAVSGGDDQHQQQQQEAMVVESGETEDGVVGVAGVSEDESMVAQLISADPPSPGGRRNVTVMLPDGNCVTMQVTQDQYDALELDK